jgi:hypothetical protein
LGGTVAAIAACGDDEGGSSTTTDAGTDTSTPRYDGDVDSSIPPTDAGGDADSGIPSAHLVLANNVDAITSGLRICFAASATNATPTEAEVLAMLPQPTAAKGIGLGEITTIDVPLPLTTKNFKAYVYFADAITGFGLDAKTCPELVAASKFTGADAGAAALLLEGVDFEVSGPYPAGTLKDTAKHLLMANGCPKSSTMKDFCETPFDPTKGSFKLHAYTLDQTAAPAGQTRLQMIHTDYASFTFGVDALRAYLYTGDGGTVETKIPEDGGVVTYDDTFFGTASPTPGSPTPSIADLSRIEFEAPGAPERTVNTRAEILAASNLSASALVPGKTFTMVPMGSFGETPTADGGLNRRSYYIRLLPND